MDSEFSQSVRVGGYEDHDVVRQANWIYASLEDNTEVLIRSAHDVEVVSGHFKDADPIDLHIITNQWFGREELPDMENEWLVLCRDYRLSGSRATLDTGVINIDRNYEPTPDSCGYIIYWAGNGNYGIEAFAPKSFSAENIDPYLWVLSPADNRFNTEVCADMLNIIRRAQQG